MELMDASIDKFYKTMHSFDNVTYKDLDHVLCRLTHNVKYSFRKSLKKFVYLTDNIGTSFS
jgi:hypothetical protein